MIDLLIFIILLGLSAFFSGTETAFTALNEYSLASMKASQKRLNSLKLLIDNKASVISALLIGNNIVNTVLAVYAGVVANKMLVKSQIVPDAVGPIIASVLSIIFLLIFGEVLPKQFGVAFAKGWCLNSTYILRFLVFIFKPIILAMNLLSRFVMKMLPVEKPVDAPTVDELMLMAENSEKAGNIDSMEKSLMYSSSQINDLTAADVMIPKSKIVAARADVKPDQLIEIFKTHLYSRIPVYKTSLDEIIGIFNIKECLKLDKEKLGSFDIRKYLIKPIYIPGNVTIGNLMEQMKTSHIHMAVVVNEYGVTDGIVTLENILERIIGLISDEYDDENDLALINKSNNNSLDLEIVGSLSIQDISKLLSIEFSSEAHHNVNTINGFLTFIKGDFVEEGDEFDYEGYHFKILSVDRRCAQKIKVTKTERKKSK